MWFGLPTKLRYFVNGSPTAKSAKELTYFYEASDYFRAKYMLAYVRIETDMTGADVTLKKKVVSYFEEDGKWGAIEQVKRWKNGSDFLTWDYTYHAVNPIHYSITVDGPSGSGISGHQYTYGLETRASAPDFLMSQRWITKYGYVSGGWNQYGHAKGYAYDDLGRITLENFYHDWPRGEDPENPPPAPPPYLTVNYAWRPDGENKVVTTRPDGNTVTRFWDGMGRDLGYTESGAGTTLYYLKQLDAEGRVTKETKGSTEFDPMWKD